MPSFLTIDNLQSLSTEVLPHTARCREGPRGIQGRCGNCVPALYGLLYIMAV
jgi:hypothetical protein